VKVTASRRPTTAGSGLTRRARIERAAHRACLAAEVHVDAGDQSLSVAHILIVSEASYKVNWESIN